jgi:hypothetical protein
MTEEQQENARKILGDALRKYWCGDVPENDNFGGKITDTFIDGKTTQGPWAIMNPKHWRCFGIGRLGLGCGQKYEKQPDGQWMKIEG